MLASAGQQGSRLMHLMLNIAVKAARRRTNAVTLPAQGCATRRRTTARPTSPLAPATRTAGPRGCSGDSPPAAKPCPTGICELDMMFSMKFARAQKHSVRRLPNRFSAAPPARFRCVFGKKDACGNANKPRRYQVFPGYPPANPGGTSVGCKQRPANPCS